MTPALVDVPFTYSMTVVRKGRRIPESITRKSSVSVPVQETSGAEAPVVARMPHPNQRDPLPHKVELRFLDDRLWIPRVTRGGSGSARVMTRDEYLAYLARGLVESSRIEPDGEAYREIVWDDEDERRAAAIEHVTSGRLIDGVPYEETPEPFFVARHVERSYVRFDIDTQVYADRDLTRVWRLDRWADLPAATERLLGEPMREYDLECLKELEPEILRPDLLRLEDDVPALRQGIVSQVKRLGDDFLKHADAGSLMAYAALRDAASDPGTAPDELARLASRLVEACDAADLPSYFADTARDSLGRWRAGKGAEMDLGDLDSDIFAPR
jgi:hypothetical protein